MSQINIYKASAGSGKTFRLTYDYIRLLFQLVTTDTAGVHKRIVAVTFTNKATEEMKSRIVKELFMLSHPDTVLQSPYCKMLVEDTGLAIDHIQLTAKKLLEDLLHDYSNFNVSTIDGFFQRIVRAFTYEIGLQSDYQLELDADAVLQRVVDTLLSELDKPQHAALLSWLIQFSEDRIESDDEWNFRKDIHQLSREIFKEDVKDIEFGNKEQLNHYKKKLKALVREKDAQMNSIANSALQLISENNLEIEDFSYKKSSFVATLYKVANADYVLGRRFLDAAENPAKWAAKTSPKRAEIAALEASEFPILLRQIVTECEQLQMYFSARAILQFFNALGILSDIKNALSDYSNQHNLMLISNTNKFLNDIIQGCDTPFIYEKIGTRIDHYMIDEFQDTSKMQWEDFRPLIDNSLSNGNENLLVGDVKQSIYRFRNSDWELLNSQVENDFCQQTRTTCLDTNWRSDQCVVEFNNAFFKAVVEAIRTVAVPDDVTDGGGEQELSLDIASKIEKIYVDVMQKPSRTSGEGYVQLSFVSKPSEGGRWEESVLEQLPLYIEECQDKGYALKDIAILVRSNGEGESVARYLMEYGATSAKPGYRYDIISDEALLVAKAYSVQLLISAIQLLSRPDLLLHRVNLASLYVRLTNNEAFASHIQSVIQNTISDENWFDQLFEAGAWERLLKMRELPLFELIESLIHFFGLSGSLYAESEALFLQAFQDLVLEYSAKGSTDLNLFLEYWEQYGGKAKVSSPEAQDAVRILTIHKSKGLEYPIVIIPFCKWGFSDNMSSIVWCETNGHKGIEDVAIVPLRVNQGLRNTLFASKYENELLYSYIDTLNIAYVGFTRARNALIVFAPKPTKEASSKSTDGILYQFAHNESFGWCEKKEDNESIQSVVYGKFSPSVKQREPLPDSLNTIYPTLPVGERLRLSYSNRLEEELEVELSAREIGNVMHRVLSEMTSMNQLDAVLDRLRFEGVITLDNRSIFRDKVLALFEIPELQEWFSGRYKVLNEAEILLPKGAIYRPDRVMIQGERAVVVDYKFGANEHKSHQIQVRNYMSLIQQMGYEVQGFVFYAQQGKIKAVN